MKEGEAEQRHGARVIMITRRRTVWTGCGSPRQRPSSCHAQVPSAAITRRPRCPSAASLGRSGRTNGRGSSLRRSLRCSEASERPLLILYRNDGFSYTVTLHCRCSESDCGVWVLILTRWSMDHALSHALSVDQPAALSQPRGRLIVTSHACCVLYSVECCAAPLPTSRAPPSPLCPTRRQDNVCRGPRPI